MGDLPFITFVVTSTACNFGRLRSCPRAKLLPEIHAKPRLHEVSWKHGDHQKRHRDIKPEYWVALGAAVSILSLMVAGFSFIHVARSAEASREQTKQQKQAAKDPAQPMLWVDIRGAEGQGQGLVLLLGNSGPSIARNAGKPRK
ncbi:MAG TPA: hypothetical protein VFO20_11615 [Propionibacteriaceae bacterium]|nr:hypothetical protein [Propionibacteriaceae bacterium]